MSASAAINPKGARLNPVGTGPLAWVDTYLASTIGQKVLVALTGTGLVLFTIGHLIGNLKLFAGPEAINAYAYFLKHELGVLIWIARAGLLTIFLLHLFVAIRLRLKASAARPVGYAYSRRAQASPASTTMVWTGIVVGAFVVFHLAHYTFAWVHDVEVPGGGRVNYLDLHDARGYHDVYRMVISGFTTWWISAIYLVAQALLFVHLSHGIASAFQTLGLTGRKFAPAAKALGIVLAGTIFVGNSALVVAVQAGYLK